MNKQIKVVIVDDHKLFIDGIKSLFEDYHRFLVIGNALNGEQLMELLKKLVPDIILLDLEMPVMDGHEAFKRIKKHYPHIKVIIVSGFLGDTEVHGYMKEGANAVIAKEWGTEILMDALYAVVEKDFYINPEISQSLLSGIQKERLANKIPAEIILSPREIEILKQLMKGKTNKEVGIYLSITPSTVDFHRRNIYAKTSIDNVPDLTLYAVRNGIISLPT